METEKEWRKTRYYNGGWRIAIGEYQSAVLPEWLINVILQEHEDAWKYRQLQK